MLLCTAAFVTILTDYLFQTFRAESISFGYKFKSNSSVKETALKPHMDLLLGCKYGPNKEHIFCNYPCQIY